MKNRVISFLKTLREKIIKGFYQLEEDNNCAFERKPWNYSKGQGGGEIGLIRGKTFEKAAVNFSAVSGDSFPMADGSGAFFGTGISLITHMMNPHAPTVHMNLRYMETEEKTWFAGGYDLTPMGFPYPEDTAHFHNVAKKTLDPFGKDLYPLFSKQASAYFFIPHWQKERGVGGIFFDHYHSEDQARDFELWQHIGENFLEAILPIYQQRIATPYSPEQKEKQLEWRAHYVEFNLLYDRGTKFGFQSGGNPEAILCSMPPLAKW